MNEKDLKDYEHIRSGRAGFYEQKRGLIAVWGREAVQFLDGMITNDMKTLEDGQQMLAAFPNAQGRLLAVVRVVRQRDRFIFETEESTREKLYNSLFRFTFAGDFFVEDVSNQFHVTTVWNSKAFNFAKYQSPENQRAGMIEYSEITWPALTSIAGGEVDLWIPATQIQEYFLEEFHKRFGAITVLDDLYETLRIETGVPSYGLDIDENTIVPELGLDGMISYTKGCYIGQEIIARIHFRGHVAKQLTGLLLEGPRTFLSAGEDADRNVRGPFELTTIDGKHAGRITSVTFSPKLERDIALAFVRYDHLAEGTELRTGETRVTVTKLPFID